MPAFACLVLTLHDYQLSSSHSRTMHLSYKNRMGRGWDGEVGSDQSWSRWSCPSVTHYCLGFILSCQGDLTCQNCELSSSLAGTSLLPFPSPSMRFLGRNPNLLGPHLNSLIAKEREGQCLLRYIESCRVATLKQLEPAYTRLCFAL